MKTQKRLLLSSALLALTVGCSKDTMIDNDGNKYKTVTIGEQVWMASNLRTTTYRDGTPIQRPSSVEEWNKSASGVYGSSFSDKKSIKQFGLYYDYQAVRPSNPRRIAPQGWRVPTVDDWNTLQASLVAGGHNYDSSATGNKVAKALASKKSWKESAVQGSIGWQPKSNNSSGFNALPSGGRDSFGEEFQRTNSASWWASERHDAKRAFVRGLYHDTDSLDDGYSNFRCGLSVRLVRDK